MTYYDEQQKRSTHLTHLTVNDKRYLEEVLLQLQQDAHEANDHLAVQGVDRILNYLDENYHD